MLSKIKIILFIGSFLATLLFPGLVLAASNVIYITPQNTTVNQGANFSVEVRIDPNSSINAVQAYVNYNSSIIQYDSLSLGAFTLCAQQSGGGGQVQISCSTTSSVNTDSLIATINFTALSGGSSGLNLSNYNAVNSSTATYTNPSAQNGSVTVNEPTPTTSTSSPASPPAPTSTYTTRYSYNYPIPSKTISNTVAPQSTPPAIPLKINSLNLHFYFSNGEIIISCNQNVSGVLKFGINPKNLSNLINGSSNSSTETFKLNPSNLTPGTKYYYQFTLNGPNGSNYTSPIKSFQTKGLNVSLLVLGSNDKNVSNLKVFIDNSKSYIATNNKGVLYLTNISPGIHTIAYKINNKTYFNSFYVQNLVMNYGNGYQTAKPQNLAVILSSYQQKHASNLWIWITIAIIVLLAIATYILSKVIKIKKLVNIFESHKDLKIMAPKI